VLPRHLKQVQRSGRINRKIGEWLPRRPVVRRLRGRMDNHLNVVPVSRKQPLHGFLVSDIGTYVDVGLDLILQPLSVPIVLASLPKKIIYADDIEALGGEEARRLRPD
jgi:hypothetical protein